MILLVSSGVSLNVLLTLDKSVHIFRAAFSFLCCSFAEVPTLHKTCFCSGLQARCILQGFPALGDSSSLIILLLDRTLQLRTVLSFHLMRFP